MIKEDLFETEYAIVEYIPHDQNVLLTWKSFCCFDDYRKPTRFALELLKKYSGSNFIVDARNGFEDDPEDIEWGFSYLLPEMSKTNCKYVIFIMENSSEIEGEMDLWTKEFGKYFTVIRVNSYLEAVKAIKTAYLYRITYKIKKEKRTEFVTAVREQNIIENSKQEPSNVNYDLYLPIENDDEVHLIEVWTSEEAFARHLKSNHYKLLQVIKEKYVLETSVTKYFINIS